MRDNQDMPKTDGRREITARANSKEKEIVREAQKLALETPELSASKAEKRLLRGVRTPKGRSRNPKV